MTMSYHALMNIIITWIVLFTLETKSVRLTSRTAQRNLPKTKEKLHIFDLILHVSARLTPSLKVTWRSNISPSPSARDLKSIPGIFIVYLIWIIKCYLRPVEISQTQTNCEICYIDGIIASCFTDASLAETKARRSGEISCIVQVFASEHSFLMSLNKLLKIKTYGRLREILAIWIHQTKLSKAKLVSKYTPAHFLNENQSPISSTLLRISRVTHNGSIA